jgi:peptidoglycan/xylan/chitin deacetylase (PgdA/CDA1 family)
LDGLHHGHWCGVGTYRTVGTRVSEQARAGVTHARSVWWRARSHGRLDAGGLRILSYHRVSDDDDPLAVSPRRFRHQMEALAAEGFQVVGLSEAVARLEAGQVFPRTLALNFDGGFRDVGENALPVLEWLGFRATVFVPTGVIDGTASFPWYSQQPAVFDWEEIVELDQAGTLRFEAHSVSHPNLLLLTNAESRCEIADSKLDLADRLGRPVEAFCYPAGLFGERERRFVAETGYRLAVSSEPGVNVPGTDRFSLRRRRIDPSDRQLDFRAKVGGGHDTPLALRGAYRRVHYGERSSHRDALKPSPS